MSTKDRITKTKNRRIQTEMGGNSKDSIFLRLSRQALGFTQSELARQIGATERTLRYWEQTGFPKFGPGTAARQKIEALLGDRKAEVERGVKAMQAILRQD